MGRDCHQLKVVAKAKGWKYDSHADLYKLRRNIAGITDDRAHAMALFAAANGLHHNYYKDSMQEKDIREDMELAEELLDLLNRPTLTRPLRRLQIVVRDRPSLRRSEMRPR